MSFTFVGDLVMAPLLRLPEGEVQSVRKEHPAHPILIYK
jgi:hypothetical protein